jgi:hypothetical protein
VTTVTDSTFSSGRPGLAAFGAIAGIADNWDAGRLTDLIDRGYDVPKAVMVYINKRTPQMSSGRSRG